MDRLKAFPTQSNRESLGRLEGLWPWAMLGGGGHGRQLRPRIRRGKIRILIDDGTGNPVPVGPIQLSSADAIEQLQDRVRLGVTQIPDLQRHPEAK